MTTRFATGRKCPNDIEETRIKLTDKKETKATNSQTIELTPVFTVNHVRKFKKDYRNVLVLPKLTFPEEKILRLEISENQISGRCHHADHRVQGHPQCRRL